MNLSKIAVQGVVFGLAIVFGSFVGVMVYTNFGIVNQLQQTVVIIISDFAVYIGLIRIAPKAAPKAGE